MAATPGHARLSSDLIELYNSGDKADVTFVFADGVIFRAHKLILTTRVAFFKKMFTSGMKESLTDSVDMSHTDERSFDIFLRYVYGGQLPNDLLIPKDIESLLTFADMYDVPDLTADCLAKL